MNFGRKAPLRQRLTRMRSVFGFVWLDAANSTLALTRYGPCLGSPRTLVDSTHLAPRLGLSSVLTRLPSTENVTRAMRLPVTRATITLDVAHGEELASFALPARTRTGLTTSCGWEATGAGTGAGNTGNAATFVK